MSQKLSREEQARIMREKLQRTLQETTFGPDNLEGVIEAIACLSNTVRHQGLLAIETALCDMSDPMLRTLMQYAIDGMTEETVMEVASDMTRAEMYQYESYCRIVTRGTEMLVQHKGMGETENRLLPILGLGVTAPREGHSLQPIIEKAWDSDDRDAYLDTFLEAVYDVLRDTDSTPSQPRATIETFACLSEAARLYGFSSLNRETLFSAVSDPILRAVLRGVASGNSEVDVCTLASTLTEEALSKQRLYLAVIVHGVKLAIEGNPDTEVRLRLHAVVDYLTHR